MQLHIDDCETVYVSNDEHGGVSVITHRVLLPFLPGILRIHGIGRLHEGAVRLDPSGWGFESETSVPDRVPLLFYPD